MGDLEPSQTEGHLRHETTYQRASSNTTEIKGVVSTRFEAAAGLANARILPIANLVLTDLKLAIDLKSAMEPKDFD